ncbi:ribonuclease D [Pontibacter qinzhouensis]|uniref:Ribonuclease D n=1 Tax=Pontibacter qinzhouensis TaxID=2603253 RepID=A0A5C8ILR1_9BACT|nr:ribonuclease D [Pontibacter qinzhouensis]TXK22052.1 ribonuclease D [Pontibacter qinzhouensis]
MEHTPIVHEGTAIVLVENHADFMEAVAQLGKSTELALDLEFDQNRFSYGFTLCLIQVTDGSGTCYIIDPFKIENLEPLYELFASPAITKIIHHANNDILLLDKLGCKIKGVMDTDVAAKILNYERSSLATVMKEEFGIEVDKSQQSSNWNKRPLNEDQLRYAAIDVIYLHRVKQRLVEKVQEAGRLPWLEEENLLLERLFYAEPENPHLRLRSAYQLNLYQQFILKELFRFRDSIGQKFDKPAAYIIANDALVELANNPNTDIHEWLNHTKGLHAGLKKPANEKLLIEALERAKKEAKEQNISHDYAENRFQRPLRTPETEQRKEALTQVQKKIVEKYGEFASRLIITQSLITEYSQTGKLRCTKQYGMDILLETATEEGIELPTPTLKKSKLEE